MWIIPSQLLNSAPDMAALDLASKTSLANDCDASHIVSLRGLLKPISSVKWKKDSWMSHLFGTILRPSLTENFTDWWTSSLQDTLANHSPQQESEQERKTPDTYGLGSQTEFGFCDQECASLRMWKGTSRWDSPASSATWKSWVTRCRGEYSLRVKLAHLTNGSGSSSWPTMHMGSNERGAYYDKTGKGQRYLSDAVVDAQKNWPTPAVMDTMGGPYKTEFVDGVFRSYHNHSKENAPQYGARLRDAVTCGLPAPTNPSTDGSRQELWPTPSADGDSRPGANADPVKWQEIADAKKAQGINKQLFLTTKVAMEEAKKQELWVTPRTSGTSTRPNKTTPRQGLTLIEQAREQEKMWRTPSVAEEKNQNTSTQIYLQNQVGATPKAWATPCSRDHHPNGQAEGSKTDLGNQVAQWGTPTARDHKSGRGNEEREYKELTPMVERTQSGKLNPRWVETLMGLPVGWVMPSCASPVTIEPTNYDCLETESCLPQQSEHLELF